MENTIEELLDSLPETIVTPREDPCAEFDFERNYYYEFCLYKEHGGYEVSYYCFLYEVELVSFTGTLKEVVNKMVEWYKNYNKDGKDD